MANIKNLKSGGNPVRAREAKIKMADARNKEMAEVIQGLITTHGELSLRETAKKLNDAGYTTARGGEWSATAVMRIKNQYLSN